MPGLVVVTVRNTKLFAVTHNGVLIFSKTIQRK